MDYELVNKMKKTIHIENNFETIKRIEAADEACEVKHESIKTDEMVVEEKTIDLLTETEKTTTNLPNCPKIGEPIKKLYIVNYEVQEANPNRVDFITPTEITYEDEEKMCCQSFNIHPDLERSEEERAKWPRWVECPNCSSYTKKRSWVGGFRRTDARTIFQLQKNSKGANDYLTVMMPSLNSQVDMAIRNGQLVMKETGIGDDKDLEAKVIE